MSLPATTKTQFELNKPPEDGITSLNFAPDSNKYLLASSWDTSVSLYDIEINERIHYYKHETPVLASCILAVFSKKFQNYTIRFFEIFQNPIFTRNYAKFFINLPILPKFP